MTADHALQRLATGLSPPQPRSQTQATGPKIAVVKWGAEKQALPYLHPPAGGGFFVWLFAKSEFNFQRATSIGKEYVE
jgi:hypothetical protein